MKRKKFPRLTKAQQRLAAENMPLVHWVARHKSLAWARESLLTVEDVVAYGNIGLCRAAVLFDKSRGVKFGTFAVYCIMTAINSEARRATHRYWRQCLTNINFNSAVASQKDTRWGVDPTRHIEGVDKVDALMKIAKKQTVKAMRYFLRTDCSLSSTGRHIGKCRERVRQMFKLLKKKAAARGFEF